MYDGDVMVATGKLVALGTIVFPHFLSPISFNGFRVYISPLIEGEGSAFRVITLPILSLKEIQNKINK